VSEAVTEPGKRTEYVVLFEHDDVNGPKHWTQIDHVSAASAKEAIKQAFGDAPGRYVAVPVRSFQPVEVRIEQKATLKFS
jgi:hypothetical protein